MDLTPKQTMFVKEYLLDLNATRAAIAAGYSKKTAQRIGSENLSKPLVSDAIQKAMDARAEKIGLTAQKVLDDINLIKQDAMAKAGDEMIDRSAALRACELEGKHLKMFTDKVEVAGKNGEPIVIVVEEFKE